MTAFLKTLAACLLAFLPGFALAETVMPGSGNTWTLYVFGNGDVIKNILMAIAAMVSEDGYRNLLSLIATIGVIALGARAGFDPKQAPKLIGYFAGVYLTMYVLLSLDANIEVNDPVSGYADVVTGVPAAVGIPAAVISNIGHWLTENVEKNFSTASSNLTLTGGGGFDMANSLARDAAQVRIIDPYLRQGMSYYMVDCVMPMIVSGAVSSADILSTNDLWSLVQSTNPGILTQYFSNTHRDGVLLTCPDAHTQLTADLATHAPTLIKAAGSAWHANNINLAGHIQSSYSWLSDNVANGTAAQTVQQAATIHLLNDSFEQAAAMTGNNEMVMSISLAQAKQTQKSQWFSASQLFKDMVGYIYSILQAFIFAVVPILLIAVLIPGFGGVILKNYGQILIWLVLWEPLLAVINYVIALYAQQGMVDTLSTGGLSMGNITAVTEQTSNFMTAAGFMATMVPMISWGLVKGAMAFTEFISAGVGSSFASSAATGMASGNVSLDSQSMGNKSLGQENLMPKASVGFGSIMGTSSGIGGQLHADFAGQTAAVNGKMIEHGVSRAQGGSHGFDSSDAIRQSQAYQHANSSASSRVLSDMENIGASYGEAWRYGRSNEAGVTGSVNEQASEQFKAGMKHLINTYSGKEDSSSLAASIGAHLKGAAKAADIDLSNPNSAATRSFLADYAGKAMEFAKDNPWAVAGVAAGIALALPAVAAGGAAASVAAIGSLAAGTLARFGLGRLATAAGSKLGQTVATGAAAGAAGKLVGEAGLGLDGKGSTQTSWKDGKQTSTVRNADEDHETGTTYGIQRQERDAVSLAEGLEAMLQGMRSQGYTGSTQINDQYSETISAQRDRQAQETWAATRREEESSSIARPIANPNAALAALGAAPTMYNEALERNGRYTEAGNSAFMRLQGDFSADHAGSVAALDERQLQAGAGIGTFQDRVEQQQLEGRPVLGPDDALPTDGVFGEARTGMDYVGSRVTENAETAAAERNQSNAEDGDNAHIVQSTLGNRQTSVEAPFTPPRQ